MLKKILIGGVSFAFLIAVATHLTYAQEQESGATQQSQFRGSHDENNSSLNIQNPFQPFNKPHEGEDNFRVPSDGSLLQQFQNQEMSKIHSEMRDKMQQFKQTQNTCGQQISTYVRQRNQQRQQLMKDCEAKAKASFSIPTNVNESENATNDSTSSSQFSRQSLMKQFIQNRRSIMQSCKQEVVAFQKETQQHLLDLRKACVSNKKQVLGLLTLTPSQW